MSTRSVFARGERHLGKRARRVQEGQAVARELLEDESLAAEEAGADAPGERDVDVDAAGARRGRHPSAR